MASSSRSGLAGAALRGAPISSAPSVSMRFVGVELDDIRLRNLAGDHCRLLQQREEQGGGNHHRHLLGRARQLCEVEGWPRGDGRLVRGVVQGPEERVRVHRGEE